MKNRFLENRFFNSKVKSKNVTKSEKWFGKAINEIKK